MDAFWVQEFMDDWAEEHSPKKLIIPKTPTKPKAAATPLPGTEKRNREARKAFEKEKHELAARFLRELDEKVTDGRLAALTESTGGIRIVWSRTLNTTAGRATWKRERVTRGAESTGNAAPNGPSHRQHATIELAEKVIDDETRLLNVVAHEFCHLAVFMLSGAGAAAKPHGSEFKSWAARCSKAFADRGIIVTTRHDYDIAFRYAWQCESCGIEYQRHSKSIDPARHRCGGGCGGQLKQTRPAPRGTAAAASGSGRDTPQPSEYQRFVKEHMPLVRRENPGSPQKDVMRIVAARWAATKAVASPEKKSEAVVENVVDELAALSIV